MNALHADGLGSVRAVTDAGGVAVERTGYRPYGEEVALQQPLTLPEAKGFIGERFDGDAGLQYLNARYYDPRLGMFVQPDWWEVTEAGVGTNRYSYAFGDPVNGRDPGGNSFVDRVYDGLFGDGAFNRRFGDKGSAWSDRTFGNAYERAYANLYSATKSNPAPGADQYPQSSYSDGKLGFFETAISANGIAASGDGIFDVAVIGSGAARWALRGIATQAVKLIGSKAVVSATGKLTAYEIGVLGEAAVRAAYDIGPKQAIEMFGRTRVPDGLSARVLSEVKNVRSLSYTQQLRDYAAYAALTNRTFDLYVRAGGGTILSAPLRATVEAGSIVLRSIPF